MGDHREECDVFGKLSQDRAAQAWTEGRYEAQVVSVEAPDLDDDGKPSDSTHVVAATRDCATRRWTRSQR